MAYSTFDGCCGSCKWMNTNEYVGSKDRCYCTYRRQYYGLTERKCSYYEYDPYKDYYDLNRRWHVVSAIFKKLGLYDSEFDCVKVLNNFRIDVLEDDKKYEEELREYDFIGPVLASFITNDPDSIKLCKEICSTCLLEILDLIKEGKNDEAFKKYRELIGMLKEYYKDKIEEYMRSKTEHNITEQYPEKAKIRNR